MKMRWKKWWSDFFFTPTDGRALAAIRIVVGLGILAESMAVWPSIDKLFGPFGICNRSSWILSLARRCRE
jgi:hypothetical protein